MTLAEHNCIAYRKLAGTPIIDVPIADHASYVVPIGAELGAFLAVLDTSDPDQWTDLHVLVAPGTEKVTGIIDWSDAAVCDPARDFGLVLRDLGPAALDATLGQYPVATIS